MELRHLRSFVAVVEARHFGRAARRLYLSPPALTAQIQQLERDLGVKLLNRSPVGLTPAGERLLAHARHTIRAADETMAAAMPYREPQAGTLRVGVMSNGAGDLMPAVLRAFMEEHPAVRVEMQSLTFVDHLPAVLEGRVQVAFLRPAPADERLTIVPLGPDPRVAVLPERHPLAECRALRTEQLLDEKFVRLAEGVPESFRGYLYLSSERNGDPVRHGEDMARDVPDVLAAVAAGRGVATASRSFARSNHWPGVRQIPIVDAVPGVNSLVHRADATDGILANFMQCAMRVVADWRGRPV